MSIFGWSLPPGCGSLPGEADDSAYEIKVDGVWWAWTEDNALYEHVPGSTEREDGYVYRGQFNCPPLNSSPDEFIEASLIEQIRQLKK